MGKKIFISDVHMNARLTWGSPKDQQYEWFQSGEAAVFDSFLDFLASDANGDVDEVILLGDIFDLWVYPHDVAPRSVAETFAANGVERGKLSTIAKSKKLSYLPGNHDMGISRAEMEVEIPGIIWLGNANLSPAVYSPGNLWAEHGHAYSMFNAPDFYNDLVDHLPLGYYISRMAATASIKGNFDLRVMWSALRLISETFSGDAFIQRVIDTVSAAANLNDNDTFTRGNRPDISLGEVRKRYEKIYEQWQDDSTRYYAKTESVDECVKLKAEASHIRVFIYGHTHNMFLLPNLDGYTKPTQGQPPTWAPHEYIAVNCGAWCDTSKTLGTFVEVDETPTQYNVSLKVYDPVAKIGRVQDNASIRKQ